MAPLGRQPRTREATGNDVGGERGEKIQRCRIDTDLLDCPICFEFLRAPIFQCDVGHAACEACYKKLVAKKCPSCALPLGPSRSIILEKVTASMQSQCKHFKQGCKQLLPYDPLHRGTHEDECKYRPLRCPVPNCSVRDILMSDAAAHMVLKHGAELVRYDRPEDRKLPGTHDLIHNGFVVSTEKRDFDRNQSQYTVVQVAKGDDDPLAAPEQNRRQPQAIDPAQCTLFLIHHQLDDIKGQHTFSLSGFGTPCHRYRLAVHMNPEEPPANLEAHRLSGKPISSSAQEAAVVDNQKPGFSLAKMVRHSESIAVLKLPATVYEVKFHIIRV